MKNILFITVGLISSVGFASEQKTPCREVALEEAHRVTTDRNPLVVVAKKKVSLATGTVVEYAYFTPENYRICRGDIRCNSAVVDVLEDTYDYPSSCKIVDSSVGDGNG